MNATTGTRVTVAILLLIPTTLEGQTAPVLPAGSASAQVLSGPRPSAFLRPVPASASQPTAGAVAIGRRKQQNPALLAAGGLVGGAAGFFGGALVGVAACQCDDVEGLDDLEAAIIGAAAGAALGIPLGVHLANGRRGNLAYSLLASAALTTVGLLVAANADDDTATAVALVAIPVSSIVASIVIERKTGDRGG